MKQPKKLTREQKIWLSATLKNIGSSKTVKDYALMVDHADKGYFKAVLKDNPKGILIVNYH